MKSSSNQVMTPQQQEQLRDLLMRAIPKLTSREAAAALQAPGTLLQGVMAAFEPFMRGQRGQLPQMNAASQRTATRFVLDVPYCGSSTIEHLLEMGNYDWRNADVSDVHFPQRKSSLNRVILRLVNFRRVIGTDEVLEKLAQSGLRAANPAELLTLGMAKPDLQLRFPIIALGQKWPLPNDDEMVVCLAWHSMLRRVHLLCQFRRDWPAHCRFAAVMEE